MNKVKSFFGTILLSQALLTTATPVLADSYSNKYSEYDSSDTRSQVDNDVNWEAIAVFGLGSLFLLDAFLGGGNNEGNYEQQSPEYYYRDNTSTPSYNPSPTPVKPISPFYGDDHTY